MKYQNSVIGEHFFESFLSIYKMNCQQETLTFIQWLSDPDTILTNVVVIVSISSFGFTVWYSKKVLRVNIRPFLMIVPYVNDVESYGKIKIQN